MVVILKILFIVTSCVNEKRSNYNNKNILIKLYEQFIAHIKILVNKVNNKTLTDHVNNEHN